MDDNEIDERTIALERAYAASHASKDEDESEDEDDRTIVVERGSVSDGDSADAEGDDDDQITFIVDRPRRSIMGDAPPNDAGEHQDEDEDDKTIAVRDTPADDDRTIAVERGNARKRGRAAAGSSAAPSQPAGKADARRRRRGISAPPVPEGFGAAAIDAPGVDAVQSYAPREEPAATFTAPRGEWPDEWGGPRIPNPALPSVARQARRTARAALAAHAITWVIAVAGIAAIGLVVFR